MCNASLTLRLPLIAALVERKIFALPLAGSRGKASRRADGSKGVGQKAMNDRFEQGAGFHSSLP